MHLVHQLVRVLFLVLSASISSRAFYVLSASISSRSPPTVDIKSPTHFDIMRTRIIGMPNDTSPVHSTIITDRLMVARRTPPSCEAAPIRAYFPMSVSYKQYKHNNLSVLPDLCSYKQYELQNIQNLIEP